MDTAASSLTDVYKRQEILDIPIYEGGTDFPQNHDIEPVSYTHLDVYKRQVLELRNVTLRYKKRTILHDIGLSAGKGEVIGVVGHNGGLSDDILKCVHIHMQGLFEQE